MSLWLKGKTEQGRRPVFSVTPSVLLIVSLAALIIGIVIPWVAGLLTP